VSFRRAGLTFRDAHDPPKSRRAAAAPDITDAQAGPGGRPQKERVAMKVKTKVKAGDAGWIHSVEGGGATSE